MRFPHALQVDGAKRRMRGMISRRPATMPKERTSLENPLKPPKLPVGPMVPRPGPTLL